MLGAKGFTLVELVVVVLIQGVVAALAAPKQINHSDHAMDACASTSIQSFRDAIEFNRAENSRALLPSTTVTAFTTAPQPYLHGANFPKGPVRNTITQSTDIDITTTTVMTGPATATKEIQRRVGRRPIQFHYPAHITAQRYLRSTVYTL